MCNNDNLRNSDITVYIQKDLSSTLTENFKTTVSYS